jgi:hypothetical protein
MDISQINADFTEDTEPRDEHLIELLGQAYKGEITCMMALSNLAAIQPYSEYKPTINEGYRANFVKKAQDGMPPALYVYAKDGKLIMSDDYSSFTLYHEYDMKKAICIVIGDAPTIEGVEYHGEPFILPLPSVEVSPVE